MAHNNQGNEEEERLHKRFAGPLTSSSAGARAWLRTTS
ncbi:MAG: hypothetical protein PWQ57_2529 [Desulfovibrionales bacterium]|nr:hypothetical protein [Desulfovibrionales bacterium]